MKAPRVLGASIFVVSLTYAQNYSVPKRLPLEPAAKREFCKWDLTPARYLGLIPESFYPIGWSRDGKFAYYYEPVDEACGCYFARLVIQDMRTDKFLYEFEYNQDDLMDADGNMPPEDDIQKLWAKNKTLFSRKLPSTASLHKHLRCSGRLLPQLTAPIQLGPPKSSARILTRTGTASIFSPYHSARPASALNISIPPTHR